MGRNRVDGPRATDAGGRGASPKAGLLRTSIRLAVPYNHAKGYAAWLERHLDGVAEVYLSLHASVVGSGRVWRGPAGAAEYEQGVRALAGVLNARGRIANLAVNVLVGRERHQATVRAVARMAEIFDRLSVTLTDFELARVIRRDLPGVALGVSTNADVDTGRKAVYWRDEVGATAVTVSRQTNKDLAALRAIHATGLTVKLVLDDECVPNCPAQPAHVARLGGGDPRFAAVCAMRAVRQRRPWLLAQKDVVPATLPRYEGLVHVGKIAGRDQTLAVIERKLGLYLEAQSFEHPHGHYVEPAEAFDTICACDRDCERCGWCPEHLVPAASAGGRAGAKPRRGAAPAGRGDPERAPDERRERKLGLVASEGEGLPALRVAVRWADATQPPRVLEVRPLAETPHPFLCNEHVGLTFFGRGDGLGAAQAAALEEAGRALLLLEEGAGSLARLAARLAASELLAPNGARGWWLVLAEPPSPRGARRGPRRAR